MRRYSIFQAAFLILLLLPLTLAINGCNTMAGVGEDLEAAGDGIEKSAKKKKTY